MENFKVNGLDVKKAHVRKRCIASFKGRGRITVSHYTEDESLLMFANLDHLEDDDGRMNYGAFIKTFVNYCPLCGEKSPKKIEFEKSE